LSMYLQEKLSAYAKEGKALLATNFYNFETLSGILLAAKSKNQPVILQLSENSIQYLGLDIAANMALLLKWRIGVSMPDLTLL
jgi:fructose/tagatose bisphosphate aldolase